MPLLRKHAFSLFLFMYALIRALSFLSWHTPVLNQAIAAVLIAGFGYLCVKNLRFAWAILVAELLLDGAGHFFELWGLLLRTWFLGIFAIVWLYHKVKTRNFQFHLPKSICVAMIVSGIFVAWSVIEGFLSNHEPNIIMQDFILFLFILLLFPAREQPEHVGSHYIQIAKAYVLGSSLFSFITLFIYSSGIGALPDTYYHWFRNIAAGKITDLGNHFFRIVLPEHSLIVPAIIIIAAYLMNNPKNKKLWFFMAGASFVLVLNFSRIYFLGLVVGFLVLKLKQNWRRWLSTSAAVACLILAIFMSTYFAASRGQSAGLALLGIRTGGIRTPSQDVSGAIRLALLPDIMRTVRLHPWFGSGLGTTVTFVHPVTKELETRTQFDWGYLELIAELGVLGTVSYLILLLLIMRLVYSAAYSPVYPAELHNTLTHGLFAGAAALFVINITTPVLHGFGMVFFVFTLTVATASAKLTKT